MMLAFSKLKLLVDGLDCQAELILMYPEGDCKLLVTIPEVFEYQDQKLKTNTEILLDVYNADHSLDERVIEKGSIVSQIFCKVWHMRKALAEFSWVDDQEMLTFETREQHPKLVLGYKNETKGIETKFQFREDIADLQYKDVAEAKICYSIESLR